MTSTAAHRRATVVMIPRITTVARPCGIRTYVPTVALRCNVPQLRARTGACARARGNILRTMGTVITVCDGRLLSTHRPQLRQPPFQAVEFLIDCRQFRKDQLADSSPRVQSGCQRDGEPGLLDVVHVAYSTYVAAHHVRRSVGIDALPHESQVFFSRLSDGMCANDSAIGHRTCAIPDWSATRFSHEASWSEYHGQHPRPALSCQAHKHQRPAPRCRPVASRWPTSRPWPRLGQPPPCRTRSAVGQMGAPATVADIGTTTTGNRYFQKIGARRGRWEQWPVQTKFLSFSEKLSAFVFIADGDKTYG